jgi:hypothetical protein
MHLRKSLGDLRKTTIFARISIIFAHRGPGLAQNRTVSFRKSPPYDQSRHEKNFEARGSMSV